MMACFFRSTVKKSASGTEISDYDKVVSDGHQVLKQAGIFKEIFTFKEEALVFQWKIARCPKTDTPLINGKIRQSDSELQKAASYLACCNCGPSETGSILIKKLVLAGSAMLCWFWKFQVRS